MKGVLNFLTYDRNVMQRVHYKVRMRHTEIRVTRKRRLDNKTSYFTNAYAAIHLVYVVYVFLQ